MFRGTRIAAHGDDIAEALALQAYWLLRMGMLRSLMTVGTLRDLPALWR